MTWANSKEKGRLTLMEMILKDELARLSQYEGKPALSAELEEHKKNYKPNTPWIQHKGGRYYVNLDDANLVPTKSDVASEDEVKKWEEASLEEKKVIVDDVLKVLKRRRQIRECVRKSRDDKKSAKKSVSIACCLIHICLYCGLMLNSYSMFVHLIDIQAKDTPPVAQTNTTTSNVNDDTPLQLPSQSVREKDVPSEITLNENDPLLIFLRSQESCIKGSVDKFYTWLVTSEDIDTIAALKEAVDEEEYLDIIKVGGGGSSVKGFKMLPFKRAVLAYDNTKAPAAAAASADALTELSRYGGKPAFSAELKLHKEYKLTQNVDTPWIQNGEDDTCYVDLGNTSLVPTKNTTNVASEDEVKKWEEASLEEKKVIVDDVLKTLKIRRQNRFCARKGRAKKNSAKKSVSIACCFNKDLLVLLFVIKFLLDVCSPYRYSGQ